MISDSKNGNGREQPFEAIESHKSNLLLEAQLMLAQEESDAAAQKFAGAAFLEEELSKRRLEQGQRDQAWVHRFSAASCWAQAGNFYQAIQWCDDLLKEPDVPESLRRRVRAFADQLRSRRHDWYASLTTTAGSEA
jgi:hypothetical protein